MYPTVWVFKTGAGQSLIVAEALDQEMLENIHRRNVEVIGEASDMKPAVFGTIIPSLCMDGPHTPLNFGFVDKLFLPALLVTAFIDMFLKTINPVERKIVLYHSTSVPVLMVYDEWNETKKNVEYCKPDPGRTIPLLPTFANHQQEGEKARRCSHISANGRNQQKFEANSETVLTTSWLPRPICFYLSCLRIHFLTVHKFSAWPEIDLPRRVKINFYPAKRGRIKWPP